MIVRDPLQMVVSAYCYHHRGAEPNSNLAPPNITEMGPVPLEMVFVCLGWSSFAWVGRPPRMQYIPFRRSMHIISACSIACRFKQ